MPRPGDLVEVVWRDSEHVRLGWASAKAYRRAALDGATYRTAGYLVARDRGSVVVSHSRSPGRRLYADAMCIPAAAVVSVRRLR